MTEVETTMGDGPLVAMGDRTLTTATDGPQPYSVVVPCYNEVDSIEATIDALMDVIAPDGTPFLYGDEIFSFDGEQCSP